MHKIYHEVIAAIGGSLFIIIGIARQRERKRLFRSGTKPEGPLVWNLLIIAGICLIVFAFGLIIFKLNHSAK
ncbi:MAG: hypothetical protein JWP37_668 [Mucilaginibacter sp.]|nr:hypothetical protein [Mucilaginibacter sp.]